jgi:CRP-like cAMP-binding protein
MSDHLVFQRLVRRLERRAPLDASDYEALGSLTVRKRVYEPNSFIASEGEAVTEVALMLEGIAYRQKVAVDGKRQIISVHIAGDFLDLEGSLLSVADHNVQALTLCDVGAIPVAEIKALIEAHPRIARALWVDTLIDGSIFREWVLNVGRRPARLRLAHLLCEFAQRFKLAGLGDEQGYELPMTQVQLGDATGLTSVHVNRSFKSLEDEGLIIRKNRLVHIPNFELLKARCGFNELYLHLDQAA